MIDKQNAFQMVHLMLDTGRHKAFQILFMAFAIKVLIAHTAGRRTINISENLRQREATFLIGRQLLRRIEDLGIDEDARIILGCGMSMRMAIMVAFHRLCIGVFWLKINHQDTVWHAHLDRSKTDPIGIIHRLKHIIDERF